MGKRNNKNTADQIALRTPLPPQPTNEYYYDDGFLRGSRIFDQGANSYNNFTYSTPDEQAIENFSRGKIRDLLNQASTAVQLTPESIESYKTAYKTPQIDAINRSYADSLGRIKNDAAASGLQDSVGFNRYVLNEIDRNKAQDLAQVESTAKQLEYDLPSKVLQPFQDLYQFYSAPYQNEQDSSLESLDPVFTGTQLSSNFTQNRYNQLLARNQFQAQYAPPRQRSFFSQLFGGY